MRRIRLAKLSLVLTIIFGVILSTPQVGLAQENQISLVIDRVITSAFPTVDVYFSIYDRSGSPLTNLSSSNFTLLEDQAAIADFTYSNPFDTQTPLAVALLIDTSDSMATGEPSSLDVVSQTAISFIENLQDHDSIGLIGFNEQVTRAQELTAEKNLAIDAINNLVPGANASLYDALFEGVEMLKGSEKKKAIILITDGVESQTSTQTLENVLQSAQTWNVPIYAVGFGPNLISEGAVSKESKLDEMAQATAGFDVILEDVTGIQSAFDTFNQLLRKIYHLSYTSTLPADSTQHQLTVQLNYNNATFNATEVFVPNPVNLALTEPGEGQVLCLQTPITVDASSSPSGIAKIQFLLDGTEISTLTQPNAGETLYLYNWDLQNVPAGDHVLTVVAVDAQGNTKEQSVNITVREPIQIQFVSPVEGDQLINVAQIKIEIDSFLELDSAVVSINDTPQQTFTEESITMDWPIQMLDDGLYKLSVNATDVQGNQAVEDISFRIGVPIPEDEDDGTSNLLMILFGGGAAVIALILIIVPSITKKNSGKKQKPAAEPQEVMQPQQPEIAPQVSPFGTSLALKEISGMNPNKVWPVDKEEISFGRKQQDNDIQLQGLSASRRMAVLRRVPEGLLLHPLHPENPVIVNGQPMNHQVLLTSGDKVQMGESVFEVI